MRTLPPVAIGDLEFRFPFTMEDQVQIAVTLGKGIESGQSEAPAWLTLFCQCPALLLIATIKFRESRSISSFHLSDIDEYFSSGIDSEFFQDAEPIDEDSIAVTAGDLNVARRLRKLLDSQSDLELEKAIVDFQKFVARLLRIGCGKLDANSSLELAKELFSGFQLFESGTQPQRNLSDSRERLVNVLKVLPARNSKDKLPQSAGGLDQLLRQSARAKSLQLEFDSQLLKEKLASLRQLAYGASHEINNPLGNIAGRAQMLAEKQAEPGLKRQLATMYQQAIRAHEMISDMMLFAHPPALAVEPVAISEIVDAIRNAFPDESERLAFEIETGESILDGDRVKIVESISAIVQNAIEADSKNLPIRIRFLDIESNQLGIQVDDSGPGVSAEVRRHMFDPFYSGREAGRGLGFGLSKAWTLAQLHGGDLTLLEKSGPGCRLLFRLPLASTVQSEP